MRSRNFPFPVGSSSLRSFLLPVIGLMLSVNPGWAANAVVRDGNTIQLDDTTYRLDGIDAPELDQTCIDDHADPWSCGIDARDRLSKLISGRPVRCYDQDPGTDFKRRHVGICTVEGGTTSLNQQLVRKGFALRLEPSTKLRYMEDEASARSDRRGLWKGCFVAPQEFRHGKKDGTLLGGSCRADKDREIRGVLFPEFPAMPPGCSIKGKFATRARFTGDVGIYHLQGCRSYPALTRPDRWFCSEDDARAAGFRRAYNCRVGAAAK
jgi:endonuclease YncB( thermonuclease family)